MRYILFILLSCVAIAQNNGIRSLNGSLNNSQRLTIDTTSSATFKWTISNGVHTVYIPYRIVNPSGSSFKWNVSGQTAKYDSLRFIAGTNVSLTQSGNTVTIATSGGGSVGNADSLGGLPASQYITIADSSDVFIPRNTTSIVPSSKYFTAPQHFRDSIFVGSYTTGTHEIANIFSNSDADLKMWTASAGDPSSVNIYRSRGTLSSPSNINAGDVVGQLRGFGYKDSFKELANITLGSQTTDTTGALFFYTRNASGLAQRWEISRAGHLLPASNNAYSIGSDGFRPDSIWGITGRFYTDVEIGTSSLSPTPAFAEKLRVNDAILGLNTINVLTNSVTTHPVFHVMRSLSGATVTSGTVLGSFAGIGYDGTSFDSDESAWMSFAAAGTFTPTSKPTRIIFATTPTGDSTATSRHNIEPSGELIPAGGDNTNSIGNATNRYATIYGINGQYGGRIVGTDIRVTDSIVGVSLNATGLMTIGASGTAQAHQISSSSAGVLTLYRGTSGALAAASGLNFSAQTANGTQVTYGTIQGLIQSNSNSLQSGGLTFRNRKSGTEVIGILLDSLSNVFLQTQNTSTNSDTRFNIRSNATGLYALAVLPSASATKQFAVDTSGTVKVVGAVSTSGAYGVAPIVDTITYGAVSSSIASRNLPSTAGTYRISYFMAVNTAGTGGTVQATISYNNGVARTLTSASLLLTLTTESDNNAFIYKVTSGTPTITVTVTGGTGSPVYSFDAVVERLK